MTRCSIFVYDFYSMILHAKKKKQTNKQTNKKQYDNISILLK